jgi:sensor histidine kinase regulating citrate/malate metabolism
VLTGKSILCSRKNIKLISYADAHLLDFIDVMDICSIFGNALDNAIECVEQVEHTDKRSIKLYVYTKNSFIMIRIENYYENILTFEDGLPKTTKDGGLNHGYGIKNIKSIAEKYGGHITITANDNWFRIMILIPLPSDNQ